MRICLHEGTRRTINITRRRTLLLFRGWSLKVQHADIFTKGKTKKRKDEDASQDANWLRKERKLPMLQTCLLNNSAIESGQIQDSFLMSSKKCGHLSTSNFFISQKICQSEGGTRMGKNRLRRVHILNWASTWSPRYQYLPWPHSNNTWRPLSS